MTRPTFIRTAGQTATLQAVFPVQRRGASGGGTMSAGRFTTGPSNPPMPNAGRVIKR